MPDDNAKPTIAITMGDPCGIGPEIIAKALASGQVHPACRPLVVGSAWSMEQAIDLVGASLTVREVESAHGAGMSPDIVDIVDPHNLDPEDVAVGRVTPACGKAAMEWVTRAAELALAGQVDALATAPVNKEAASLAGYKAIGHMELPPGAVRCARRGHHADDRAAVGRAPHHPPLPPPRLRLRHQGPDPGQAPADPRQLRTGGHPESPHRRRRPEPPRQRRRGSWATRRPTR